MWCDVTRCGTAFQVELRVEGLYGQLRTYRAALGPGGQSVRPSAVCVEAVLSSHGEAVGIPVCTPYVDAALWGCEWDAVQLTFPVKVRCMVLDGRGVDGSLGGEGRA